MESGSIESPVRLCRKDVKKESWLCVVGAEVADASRSVLAAAAALVSVELVSASWTRPCEWIELASLITPSLGFSLKASVAAGTQSSCRARLAGVMISSNALGVEGGCRPSSSRVKGENGRWLWARCDGLASEAGTESGGVCG